MKARILLFVLGLAFGFALVRAGATDPDAIAGMFLLTDFHIVGVIAVAIVSAGIGFHLLRRRAAADPSLAQALAAKPVKPGLIAGAVLFGAGWALTGTCPGTGLAQIGEGRLMGLFTVAGIFVGVALHGRAGGRIEEALRALPTRLGGARPEPEAAPPSTS